ncbi:MAG: lipid A biosynthesis acyltransferase [Bacteroidota bacterium]
MLTRLLFYLIIKPLSYLPLPILHRLSDVLFFLLYYLAGYRKKLVLENMRRSFPAQEEAAIQAHAKTFFRHFCDVMVETIRLFSMPRAELKRRVKIINPELFEYYKNQGRSVAITSGHCGNWEWAVVGFGLYIPQQVIAIYKRLSNPFLEKVIKQSRARFGMQLIRKDDFKTAVKQMDQNQLAVVFASDQAPSSRQKVHWTTFLHQETAVMMGAEVYAKRYNYVVLITNIKRVRRGYYEIIFEVVEEQPMTSTTGVITEQHTRILEQQIQQTPHNWLWTHRRWKRKKTEAEI